ncbi:MAG: protein kinase domain-containing protein [Phycisphaerales bacterium]
MDELIVAGGIDAREGAKIGLKVAEALATLHRAGWVHRDVKPANIALMEDRVAFIDFGAAERIGTKGRNDDRAPEGTITYLAPEVLQEVAVGGSGVPLRFSHDRFALGCTLYQLLTGGSHPFGIPPLVNEETAAYEMRCRVNGYSHDRLAANLLGGTSETGRFLADTISNLLDNDAGKRPAASDVTEVLEKALADAGVTGADLLPACFRAVRLPRADSMELASPADEYLLARPEDQLVGREDDLGALDSWAFSRASSPVLCLTALGGVGKSMLTATWLRGRSEQLVRDGYATPIFINCYASKRLSLPHLAAAVLGRERAEVEREWSQQSLREGLVDRVLKRAQEERLFLVLDGIERNMRAYAGSEDYGFDEPNVEPTEAEDNPPPYQRRLPRQDAAFIERFAGVATESRLLLTSRLLPADLQVEPPKPTLKNGCSEHIVRPLPAAAALKLFEIVVRKSAKGKAEGQSAKARTAQRAVARQLQNRLRKVFAQIDGHGLTVVILAKWYLDGIAEGKGAERAARLLDLKLVTKEPKAARAEVLEIALEDLLAHGTAFALLNRVCAAVEPMLRDRVVASVRLTSPGLQSQEANEVLDWLIRRGVIGSNLDGLLDIHPVVRRLIFELGKYRAGKSRESKAHRYLVDALSGAPGTDDRTGPGEQLRECRRRLDAGETEAVWRTIRDQIWSKFWGVSQGGSPALLPLLDDLCRQGRQLTFPPLARLEDQATALSRLAMLCSQAGQTDRARRAMALAMAAWRSLGRLDLVFDARRANRWDSIYSGAIARAVRSLESILSEARSNGESRGEEMVLAFAYMAAAIGNDRAILDLELQLRGRLPALSRWFRQTLAEGLAYLGEMDRAMVWMEDIAKGSGEGGLVQEMWERVTVAIAVAEAARPITMAEYTVAINSFDLAEETAINERYVVVECLVLAYRARLATRQIDDPAIRTRGERIALATDALASFWSHRHHDRYQIPLVTAANAQAALLEMRRG